MNKNNKNEKSQAPKHRTDRGCHDKEKSGGRMKWKQNLQNFRDSNFDEYEDFDNFEEFDKGTK